MKTVLCVGATPAVQRVMVFPRLEINAVNRAVRTLESIAGKSVNVAKVLKRLGEEPVALGFAGGARGEVLLAELVEREIQHHFVKVEVATRECVTVIDESAGTQTELVEESQPVSGTDYEHLTERINHHRSGARAIVMSGTLTPGGPEDFYERCTRAGHEAGLLTVVDAKGEAMLAALAERPGLVKPNRAELELTAGRRLPDERAVLGAMQELGDRGAERVVVTSGGGPAIAWERQGAWRITPPKVRVLNPIGSGDSFTAAVVWRLLRDDDLGEACRWGAAAGAANALQWMTGEVEVPDVERLIGSVEVERISG